MQSITISNPMEDGTTITMNAWYESTRNGFRHLANTSDGVVAKCTYINRTWEVYTYQTVLHKLAYNWIIRRTGWNPKTKRDGQKFNEMYAKMKQSIDASWW